MNLARIKSFRELPPRSQITNVFSVSEIAITWRRGGNGSGVLFAPPFYFEEKKCGFA